jgi:predicted DNA-binding ribbon-helix-helix protein
MVAEQRPTTADEGSGPNRHFRIVRIDGKRRAFSLEPVFWTALERAARQLGLRLNRYITQVLAQAPDGNSASVLRCAAVQWLLLEQERLRTADPIALATGVTQAIPVPALVLDERKRIIAHNQPFLALGHDDDGSPARFGPVHLHLPAPLPRLLERLTQPTAPSLGLDFVLEFGPRKRTGVLNATLLTRTERGGHILCVVRSVSPLR